jgi:hypothetical protein
MSIIFGKEITKTDIFITHFSLIVGMNLKNFIHNDKMTSSLERNSFIKGLQQWRHLKHVTCLARGVQDRVF